MGDFLKQQREVIGLLIISALFICCLFPQLVFHPNDILLVGEGDGLKSYFSFYYHIEYDKSFLHFKGMNYPHGEHYMYTDGFPLIAWLVQALPFLKPFGIGLIHISLVLSLWLTPPFIYFLLKKFNTETWLALLGACSLFLLQPQFPRLFSHLSLAYSLFFSAFVVHPDSVQGRESIIKMELHIHCQSIVLVFHAPLFRIYHHAFLWIRLVVSSI